MEDISILEYMNRRWDAVGRKLALAAGNLDEYQQWKQATTARLKELIGYDTMLAVEPECQHFSTEDEGDHLRHHIAIQTEPDIWMPMYVLEPKDVKKPLAPVIALHGHCSGGKVAVAGIESCDEVKETIVKHNYDYGKQLCKAGFLVFCPDSRGFGQRKEATADTDVLGGSCRQINAMAYPLGQTITGMWVWDIHRLIDYIEIREDCDADRLACVGLSGGGMQTLWATALDERIKSAVISGYFYGYRQSLLELHNNCWCNFVPHLYEYVDIGEIAALIAPRPLFIETGDKDELNGASGIENVIKPLETVKKAYQLFDKTDRLKHLIQPGEHQWYGEGVAEWLKCSF